MEKWEDKFNLVVLEGDSLGGVSGDELQVFYKVKLFLADVYLMFVRKLYRSKQIYSYFNIHNTG